MSEGAPEGGGLVRCEITGREVPADETVVFQGHRVSAAGKLILVDRLNAGEAMPGEPQDASRRRRLGAAVLDVVLLVAVLLGVLALVFVFSGDDTPLIGGDDRGADAVAAMVTAVIFFLYFGLTQSVNGQTLGKRLLGIRVVAADGSRAAAGPVFLRSAVLALPDVIGPLLVLILGISVEIESGIDLAVAVFNLFDVCLIFGAARLCLHDRIAGTRVVRNPSGDTPPAPGYNRNA